MFATSRISAVILVSRVNSANPDISQNFCLAIWIFFSDFRLWVHLQPQWSENDMTSSTYAATDTPRNSQNIYHVLIKSGHKMQQQQLTLRYKKTLIFVLAFKIRHWQCTVCTDKNRPSISRNTFINCVKLMLPLIQLYFHHFHSTSALLAV